MSLPIVFPDLSEADVVRLADDIAFMLQSGDVLRLDGDLGAGKTTFARALIRSLAGDPTIEVPSPTFTLVQHYATPRLAVAHLDLYRITSPAEVDELGVDAALEGGVVVIEWPANGGDRVPPDAFTLSFAEQGAEARTVTLSASEALSPRIDRLAKIRAFLTGAGWTGPRSRMSYLQGDASPRRYARLSRADGERAIVMDAPRRPDGPPIRDRLPYSRIAHLAEDVSAFAAIASALLEAGFSVPRILAHDLAGGLLLIEDLGDAVFAAEVTRGAAQEPLWRRGVQTLIALRSATPSPELALPGGGWYRLPKADHGALGIECELLLDWYYPAIVGTQVTQEVRTRFLDLWGPLFDRVLANADGWLLRDYHSPNLLALDGRQPPQDVGIIDFQDAMIGPEAYDLVSLLQDARVDVPENVERSLLDRYVSEATRRESDFDADKFRFDYAALGAQRNSKILGIFTRLAVRDGKRQYLAHIPRIWRYLERNLAHPELAALKEWYDRYLPTALRSRALDV